MKTKINDIVIALFLLFFLSPVIVIISILIKIDSPGPIAIKIERSGDEGRKYFIYRFRTGLVELKDGKLYGSQKTKFGKLLCQYRLDTLPQLYSIAKGDLPFELNSTLTD